MIDVIGVGADGLSSVGPAARGLIERARVVVSSPRLLALLPGADEPTSRRQGSSSLRGDVGPGTGQLRLPWPSPLRAGLPALFDRTGTDEVVVLATGDPLVSGVGTTLVEVLGAQLVRVHPAVSSVALARARMRWSAEQSQVLSLVSTPASAVRRLLCPGARLVLLSAGARTPGEVAAELVAAGWPEARLTVLSQLGTWAEATETCRADEWGQHRDAAALNVVAVELPREHSAHGTTPGLPEDLFDHDGQITKAEVRAAALAALRPMPGQLLWDLGAGSGSVGIEWALGAERARAVAVERDPDRAARIARNAARLGVPHVEVVVSDTSLVATPDHELPCPDAVFVGGGATRDVVEAAWAALRPHGRIVVHAVTLETEAVAVEAFRSRGGALRRISVERAEPLGRSLSWTPARPVVQWSCTKETP